MNTRHKQPDLLTKYLLGDLSEPERQPFEESYFTDDEVFAELLETENKLIIDYLQGRLARREKELFEQHYLATPCGQRKLELAWLLDRSETAKSILSSDINKVEPPSPNPSWFQSLLTRIGTFKPPIWIPAMASVLIAVIIGGVALRKFTSTMPGPGSSEITSSSPPASLPANPGEIVERIELEPGIVNRSSGGSDKTLRTGSATKFVELNLKLAAPIYSKYQGQVLNKQNNAKVTSEDSLTPEPGKTERFVLWKIEAEVLPQGDYSVELRGVTPGGEAVDPSSYDLKVRTR